MLQFSFWDILSNLLIATQWTIVLSLIAFLCGGIVGLIAVVHAHLSGSRHWNGSPRSTSSSSRARRC